VKIGLSYNLRTSVKAIGSRSNTAATSSSSFVLPGDDHDEEFDSPATIEALANTLIGLGHDVELLGEGTLLLERLLKDPRPDLVWNIAEGTGRGRAREAQVPAVLEIYGIPYTGSDPLTLAAALDKDCAKRLVAAAGVATPAWALYDGDFEAIASAVRTLAFPVFAKPAYEGSSKGILTASIFHDEATLREALAQLHDMYRQPILVEEFIDGDELTVGLIGNRPVEVLGVMRVLPKEPTDQPFVYSLEMKRDWQRQLRYECPAPIGQQASEAVHRTALDCFQALGCRDVARVDFRLRDGVPYFLEANPLPGLSPTSGDLVLLAGHLGITYAALVTRILDAALTRLSLSAPISSPA
jgi:D-alanine-D-alanine ligase